MSEGSDPGSPGEPEDPDPLSNGSGEDVPEEPPDVDDLLDQLEELETTVDTGEERRQVREAIRVARRVDTGGAFGRTIYGYDVADLTEAVLGSLLFGIPMAVEGGTLESGAFVATHPLYLGGTLFTSVLIVVGILYVADIQEVRVYRPFFGVIPRRLVGVLGVSFLSALALMTAWGRVDWVDPWIAFSQVAVAFVPMSIGAALGDILPGS
jgi:uncharacterized membrane protein